MLKELREVFPDSQSAIKRQHQTAVKSKPNPIAHKTFSQIVFILLRNYTNRDDPPLSI